MIASAPIVANTSSKLRVYWPPPSWITKRTRRSRRSDPYDTDDDRQRSVSPVTEIFLSGLRAQLDVYEKVQLNGYAATSHLVQGSRVQGLKSPSDTELNPHSEAQREPQRAW